MQEIIVTLSVNKIMELIHKTLTPEQVERSFIYWDKRILPKGNPIKAGLQTLSMPFEGTMVFVDLAPRANWAHPCLYVFIQNDTFSTKVDKASFPPNIDEKSETFIILLRYGKKPAHERDFNAFDS
jgi:hypothetical protein